MFFVNASDNVLFYGGERNLIAAYVASGKMVATSSRTFLPASGSERLEPCSDDKHHLVITMCGYGLGLLAILFRLVDLLTVVSHFSGLGWIFPLRWGGVPESVSGCDQLK